MECMAKAQAEDPELSKLQSSALVFSPVHHSSTVDLSFLAHLWQQHWDPPPPPSVRSGRLPPCRVRLIALLRTPRRSSNSTAHCSLARNEHQCQEMDKVLSPVLTIEGAPWHSHSTINLRDTRCSFWSSAHWHCRSTPSFSWIHLPAHMHWSLHSVAWGLVHEQHYGRDCSPHLCHWLRFGVPATITSDRGR